MAPSPGELLRNAVSDSVPNRPRRKGVLSHKQSGRRRKGTRVRKEEERRRHGELQKEEERERKSRGGLRLRGSRPERNDRTRGRKIAATKGKGVSEKSPMDELRELRDSNERLMKKLMRSNLNMSVLVARMKRDKEWERFWTAKQEIKRSLQELHGKRLEKRRAFERAQCKVSLSSLKMDASLLRAAKAQGIAEIFTGDMWMMMMAKEKARWREIDRLDTEVRLDGARKSLEMELLQMYQNRKERNEEAEEMKEVKPGDLVIKRWVVRKEEEARCVNRGRINEEERASISRKIDGSWLSDKTEAYGMTLREKRKLGHEVQQRADGGGTQEKRQKGGGGEQ